MLLKFSLATLRLWKTSTTILVFSDENRKITSRLVQKLILKLDKQMELGTHLSNVRL